MKNQFAQNIIKKINFKKTLSEKEINSITFKELNSNNHTENFFEDEYILCILCSGIIKNGTFKTATLKIYEDNKLECINLFSNFNIPHSITFIGFKLSDQKDFENCIAAFLYMNKNNQFKSLYNTVVKRFPQYEKIVNNDKVVDYLKIYQNMDIHNDKLMANYVCFYLIVAYRLMQGKEMNSICMIVTSMFYDLAETMKQEDKEEETIELKWKKLPVRDVDELCFINGSIKTWKDFEDIIFECAYAKVPDAIFNIKKDTVNLYRAIISCNLLENLFKQHSFDISQLLNSETNKAEYNAVKRTIDCTIEDVIANYPTIKGEENNNCLRNDIDIYYSIALFVNKFIIEYKNCCTEYFKSGAKELYIECETLKKQIEYNQEIIRQKDAIIKKANEEIVFLKNGEKKVNKEIIAPVEQENRVLREQIAKFEQQLIAEQEKNIELNALREFAFSIEQFDISKDKSIDLNELIKIKKIVIIGGHENWQNKMRKEYPSLILINGHQNFDTTVLFNADKVFLFTANMSHKIYYTVIDILKNKKIPFDYIGKFNTELVINEIAEKL